MFTDVSSRSAWALGFLQKNYSRIYGVMPPRHKENEKERTQLKYLSVEHFEKPHNIFHSLSLGYLSHTFSVILLKFMVVMWIHLERICITKISYLIIS